MAGMHRDKCGAAAVAGYFKYLDEAKPDNIKVGRQDTGVGSNVIKVAYYERGFLSVVKVCRQDTIVCYDLCIIRRWRD